ncbi:protein phosphatase 2a regulatory b subunit (b56 family) protein [Cardiosporidium cionae]|uniref:Protein phosphatase 2a regulatory b subunit (B56 family) protein n=1 Tax=Cardiosporidium cionae TaxID=476202 RepID=A0ABQ7J7I0_9APIC|nr:protein phosphatase 2a regulatory b subunit (b56 family) protein [Cardiosporidium cionae]|eukprot:KAF8819941.1 protein phosphatase 2a regulatory b subunit (b56 family) protein [Cardiosporidium cionae]
MRLLDSFRRRNSQGEKSITQEVRDPPPVTSFRTSEALSTHETPVSTTREKTSHSRNPKKDASSVAKPRRKCNTTPAIPPKFPSSNQWIDESETYPISKQHSLELPREENAASEGKVPEDSTLSPLDIISPNLSTLSSSITVRPPTFHILADLEGEEFHEAILHNLKSCCYDSKTLPSGYTILFNRNKEGNLKELHQLFLVDRSCYEEAIIDEVFAMIKANLFRTLTPSTLRISLSFSELNDDENILDEKEEWYYLQYIYGILLLILNSGDIPSTLLQNWVNEAFLLKVYLYNRILIYEIEF